MSTEKEVGESSQKPAPTTDTPPKSQHSSPKSQHPQQHPPSEQPATPPKPPDETLPSDAEDKKQAAGQPDQPSDTTSPSTPPDDPRSRPRQVIAVSASKGPAAFFNLARKFLVTDEICDLSALEGAIVSACDAAHLLERSKLATIVRVQTSYVTVEPKRRRQVPSPHSGTGTAPFQHGTAAAPASPASTEPSTPRGRSSSGRELRRARIVITVKRTESYKQWLEDNPLQAVIAGDGDDEGDEEERTIDVGARQQRRINPSAQPPGLQRSTKWVYLKSDQTIGWSHPLCFYIAVLLMALLTSRKR